MTKEYLAGYMDRLVSLSRKLKETPGNDKHAYFKKLISCLKAANPYIQPLYEAFITEALEHGDFAKLQSVFLHSARVKLLPGEASGYDHCDCLWPLLDLLACDDFDNVYRVLPKGLPLSANGYPMYVHGTNLLLCLLYNADAAAVYPADKIIEKAEKFAAAKKSLWERSVISCLLGILQKDAYRISDSLQQICVGFVKADAAKYMKMQCQNAYGLLMLARHFLSEADFAQIVYPECKNFSRDYMLWLLGQKELPEELCITYASPVKEYNDLLKRQIAITRIHQPYLDSDNPHLSARDKKAYYMDSGRMLAEFMQ